MAAKETRSQYNSMAQSYDAVADREEKLAASVREAPKPDEAPPSTIKI